MGIRENRTVSLVGTRNNRTVSLVGTKKNRTVSLVATRKNGTVSQVGTMKNRTVSLMSTRKNRSSCGIDTVEQSREPADREYPQITSQPRILLSCGTFPPGFYVAMTMNYKTLLLKVPGAVFLGIFIMPVRISGCQPRPVMRLISITSFYHHRKKNIGCNSQGCIKHTGDFLKHF